MNLPPPLDKKRVLVVDDEPQIAAALTDILEDDYQVIVETSPEHALRRLRDGDDVSAILCDQRMPGMTGDKFLAAAQEHTTATRILITGYADLEAVARAVNDGKIFGYLTKPWERAALLNMVRHAVDYCEVHRTLLRERALFGHLMRSISDGVFFKDKMGRYIRLNDAEAGIVGLSTPDDAIGKTLYDLLPASAAARWSAEERAALKSGGRAAHVIRDIAAPDGKKKWYAVNMAAVRNADGEIDGLVGVSRDVTEEKNVQEMKDEFVSTVSHELRTPLTSIQGALALLRGGVAGVLSKDAKSVVEISYNNCGRLLRLVNDILDLSKLDHGVLRIEREPVDVASLLEEAVAANEGCARPEGQTIELVRPVPRVRVSGDRDRLLQVLANLISNALKFSPPGGKVRLRAKLVNGHVRICVVDMGGGVPEGFGARIFQRFSQADGGDARLKGGAGLGLNISRSIIELHDGRINYQTRRKMGTKFYFELPLARCEESTKSSDQESNAERSALKRREFSGLSR